MHMEHKMTIKTDDEVKALCDVVRETAFALHSFLRHGHLEKGYESGLAHRLRKKGLKIEQQKSLQLIDEDGTVIGDYFADLWVENCLIVELKACKALSDEHTAQVLGYLRAANQRHALLINFGAPRFEIKKLIL